MIPAKWFAPALALATLAVAHDAHAQGGPPPLDLNAVAHTADLFRAIRSRDTAQVTAALERGADPNRKNWIDLYPLDWALMLGGPKVVDLLIERGAKSDASSYGSPVTAAVMTGHDAFAVRLLEQGVPPTSTRPDKATALMLAAAFGAPRAIERMQPSAADLATVDIDGATALIYAARLGQVSTARILLARGAKVDAADKHGRTPLMYAAQNGHLPMVELLLAHGAKPGLTDSDKATALHLATRYSGNPGVVRRLIAAKAPLSRPDAYGKTPLTLAQWRRNDVAAAALRAAGARAGAPPTTPALEPAIRKSLTTIQGGMKRFLAQSQCSSCHHQGLGLATVARARMRGFAVESAIIDGNVQRVVGDTVGQMAPLLGLATQNPAMRDIVPTAEIGDIGVTAGYAFWALDQAGSRPNPGLTAFAKYLAVQQLPDGSWSAGIPRGPMQASPVLWTAMQALGVRRFLPAAESGPVLAKAQGWLSGVPVATNEDRAAQLLGLRWTDAHADRIAAATTSLALRQNADGGWGARRGVASDPLTTGMALYSLRVGGALPTGSPTVKKAIAYLLRTQDENGAWYLNKTIQPFNYFFDTGFPGGESQYASFGASTWATLGLMEAAPQKRAASR